MARKNNSLSTHVPASEKHWPISCRLAYSSGLQEVQNAALLRCLPYVREVVLSEPTEICGFPWWLSRSLHQVEKDQLARLFMQLGGQGTFFIGRTLNDGSVPYDHMAVGCFELYFQNFVKSLGETRFCFVKMSRLLLCPLLKWRQYCDSCDVFKYETTFFLCPYVVRCS